MGSSPPTVFRGWRSKYRVASKKLKDALIAGEYKEAANVGVRAAIVTTPPKQSFNIILASVEAYREAKEQNWQPSSESLAERGIREAERTTKYKLAPQQEQAAKRLIQKSLEKAKAEAGEAT